MKRVVGSVLGILLVAAPVSADYGPWQEAPEAKSVEGRANRIPALARDFLAREKVPLVPEDLAQALGRANSTVRLSAAIALGFVGTPDQFPALLSALGDKDGAVATSALMSLYRRSSEESLRPASQWRETLRERAEDMLQTLDTPLDKLQVAQVLARMGDPSGESVVLQQLQPGGAQIIAQQIVPLLVKIQPESGRGTRLVQALGRLLTDPSRSDDARATTATVLGRVGTPEARETLREGLAREATEPVRAAIESALSTKPAPHSGAQKWGSVLRAWTAGRNDPRRPGLHKG